MKVLKAGTEGLSYKPQSNITCVKEGIEEIKQHHNHLKGAETWFQHPPHSALGDNLVHALQADVKRANSGAICLAN